MQMIRLPVMRLDWDEFTKKQNKTKKNGNFKKKNPLDPIQKKQVWKINEWLPAHTTRAECVSHRNTELGAADN